MDSVVVEELSHSYGARVALDLVRLKVAVGDRFALLGPNGGGKTTLFRILATLIRPRSGRALVLGHDVATEGAAIRRKIGIVFQTSSLDNKLTVLENLRHHGHLYGLSGADLRGRIEEMMKVLAVADRAGDLVQTLSGGLRRRVEVAKGMLHRPQLLLMDEPTTGLDPGARRDLWTHVATLQGVTVLYTTHLLEEAERATRLAILAAGKVVADGTPEALRSEIAGDIVTAVGPDASALGRDIGAKFGVTPAVLDGSVRIEIPRGHEFVPKLIESFPGRISSVTMGKPTLEDVYVRRTGRRFGEDA